MELFRKIFRKRLSGIQNETNRLKWLENVLLSIPNGSRILDAGAGALAQKKFCTHLNYISQDFGKYDGIGDEKGLQTKMWYNSKLDIISDITNIPEPDSSFDAIMCVEVFEHLPDPILTIKEFSRLLKNDGILILTEPFCSLTHFAPYHFYSGFNRYFYAKHLLDNSFKIMEIEPNGNFFEYLAQELLRLPYCAKKYSKNKISMLDQLAILKLNLRLKCLSDRDFGSNEILNYGFHVVAKKSPHINH
ncbi:MAG: methyltransferase domain-containing protein [Saprospiraceae bacterium]